MIEIEFHINCISDRRITEEKPWTKVRLASDSRRKIVISEGNSAFFP